MNDNKVFEETQSFSRKWVFGVLLLLLIYLVIAFYCQAVKHITLGNYGMTDKSYIVTIIIVFVTGCLMYWAKLKTRIDEKGISYRFLPFQFKFKLYTWNELEQAYVRTYSPLGEYGGWGYRIGPNGTAITTIGETGIQLKTKTGKSILLGTSDGELASKVLAEYADKIC